MAGVTFLNVTAVSASVDACSAKCDDNNLWWLGVLLGLLGSIFINTGNNIQSLGLHQLSERLRRLQDETTWDECGEPHSPKTQAKLASLPPPKDLDRSVMWRCGTAVFLTGSLMNFASYGLAPAQLLAPLESIQFVTNICFSKFMLGKAITWKMYGGTLLIFGGTVLTVLNSSKCEGKRTISRLIELYTENEAYQVYLVLVVVMAASTYSLHGVYERRLCAGKPLPHTCTAMPVLYAWFSALFGTQSVVQAKCLAVLLGLAGERGAAYVFTNWFTYVCILAWAALVTVWLHRMNAALGLYDPIFIVPLLQVDFILFAIISGGIYFREFRCFTTVMWVGFSCGIAVIFLGLFLLAPADCGDEDAPNATPNATPTSRCRVAPLPPQLRLDVAPMRSDGTEIDLCDSSDEANSTMTPILSFAEPGSAKRNANASYFAPCDDPAKRVGGMPALHLAPRSPRSGGARNAGAEREPNFYQEMRKSFEMRRSFDLPRSFELPAVTSISTHYTRTSLDSARRPLDSSRRRPAPDSECGSRRHLHDVSNAWRAAASASVDLGESASDWLGATAASFARPRTAEPSERAADAPAPSRRSADARPTRNDAPPSRLTDAPPRRLNAPPRRNTEVPPPPRTDASSSI
ncbi:magnesium transporter NIPA-domain-containing protein [Pelagophyceae sp. CCMP2097]|nr:magnesium transporter NIPA-domain-containing protein [Pelagophyceae sp. CCMP2097]